MVDTKEVGAGSYPDAPESKLKCYETQFYATVKFTVCNWAKTEKEAEEEVNKKKFDEIIEQKIEDIEWIKDIKEVEK